VKLHPRLVLDIGWQDFAAGIFGVLRQPSKANSLAQIQACWPTDHTLLVNLSVRTAFDLLLTTLQLPPGSEIIVSAINIRHMVEIIEQHHCVLRPIDIDLATLAPDLTQLKAAISPRTRLVLIAHLYGAITPLDAYAEICHDHDLLLVEDCAQAFAGQQYLGHPQADVSLFSFGPIKSCTALGGAVTLVKDPQLAKQMKLQEQDYPLKSEAWFAKRLLKYFWLKVFSQPVLLGMLMSVLRSLKLETDTLINSLTRGFAAGDILTQLRYQPPKGLLNLLRHRLQTITDQSFQYRAKVAASFLAQLHRKPQPGHEAVLHSYWLVPILTDNPTALIQTLQAAGFDATRGTTSLTSIGEMSPNAHHLIDQVVYLPVSRQLPTTESLRLAELVNGSMAT
jgi:dTDP-4-amino-4,6-dideoxygalactose transaminase